jgi:UDP-N-acetylglucosamine--N-acetylmuramyl-(pentapeptide) pyrophosphoryl-undecaprenol N-acetylglucosamine transferase
MAGWFYRIPIIIHESDSVPGIANLFSSRMATRIAVAFEQTLKYFKMEKTAYIGNPIRPKLLAGTPEQKKAKNQLGFADSEPLIFITGGSQGAQRINDFIVASLPLILPIAQVYHQTGNRNIKNVEESTSSVLKTIPEEIKKHHSYKAVGYVERDELQLAYAAADIVISRAGSGSIYEIAGFKKPSILIPLLESANDHQRLNAYDFMKAGACIVIEESNLLPTIFVKELSRLLKNPEQLKAMGEAAWKFFKPEAANMLAQELLRLAR